MKYRWLIAGFLIVALILICAAGGFALWQGARVLSNSGIDIWTWSASTVSLTDSEEHRLTVSGELDLVVNNLDGNIIVEAVDGNEVVIRADKTAWGGSESAAQKAMDGLKVIVEQDGNSVKITSRLEAAPPDVMYIGSINGSVDYTISVPRNTSVNLVSKSGKLSLAGVSGNASLETDFGSIEARGVSANPESGWVRLSSKFGAISAENTSGRSLEVDSQNGTINLDGFDIATRVKVESQFGNISLNAGQAGSVGINSSNGKITLTNLQVEDKLVAKSGFGDVSLVRVEAAGYELETQNGGISLDGGRGTVNAKTSFGNIEILNVRDARLDLVSQNGAITFRGAFGEGLQRIESSFGEIKIFLPADTSIDLDLKTEFGSIKSDFEMMVSGDFSQQQLIGRIGNGGDKLTVRTQNGSIYLFKVD